jgi:hypothetical protein
MALLSEVREAACFRVNGARIEVCCEHVNHISTMEDFITQEVNGMTVRQLRCVECGNQITIFIDNSQRSGGRTATRAQTAANA